RSFLGHRGGDGAWRVVIVDSSDELNVNAANALLKSLEEPPERTLFLLVTSEPGRLLATIRSRCRTLDLKRLVAADLEQAARQALGAAGRKMPQGDAASVLTRLADGSVRRFLSLEASGGLALYQEIYDKLKGSHFRFLEAAFALTLDGWLEIGDVGEEEVADASRELDV
ncbi:MAG: hypothetical protein ACWGMY_09270, partial [Hyphomicrobiaceae bacterium]